MTDAPRTAAAPPPPTTTRVTTTTTTGTAPPPTSLASTVAGLKLDALTQADRDNLRGWNDLPTAMTKSATSGGTGLRTKHRHVGAPDVPGSDSKAVPAVDPSLFASVPPPTSSPVPSAFFTPTPVSTPSGTPATTPAQHQNTAVKPATTATAADQSDNKGVPHTVVHEHMTTRLNILQSKANEKVARDIHRRLTPLLEKVASASLPQEVIDHIARILTADRSSAEKLHGELVMHFHDHVGVSAVALKKLITLA